MLVTQVARKGSVKKRVTAMVESGRLRQVLSSQYGVEEDEIDFIIEAIGLANAKGQPGGA